MDPYLHYFRLIFGFLIQTGVLQAVILVFVLYLYLRRVKDKVHVQLRTKSGYNRTLWTKPDRENFVWIGKDAYRYNQASITYARRGIFKLLTPTLDFVEGNSEALGQDGKLVKGSSSPADLALLANNHVAYDFDRAAMESFTLKSLAGVSVVVGVILLVAIAGSSWYLFQAIEKGAVG